MSEDRVKLESALNEGDKLLKLLRCSPDNTEDSIVAEYVSQKMDELFQLQTELDKPHKDKVTTPPVLIEKSVVSLTVRAEKNEEHFDKEQEYDIVKETKSVEDLEKCKQDSVKIEVKRQQDDFQELESNTDEVSTKGII